MLDLKIATGSLYLLVAYTYSLSVTHPTIHTPIACRLHIQPIAQLLVSHTHTHERLQATACCIRLLQATERLQANCLLHTPIVSQNPTYTCYTPNLYLLSLTPYTQPIPISIPACSISIPACLSHTHTRHSWLMTTYSCGMATYSYVYLYLFRV